AFFRTRRRRSTRSSPCTSQNWMAQEPQSLISSQASNRAGCPMINASEASVYRGVCHSPLKLSSFAQRRTCFCSRLCRCLFSLTNLKRSGAPSIAPLSHTMGGNVELDRPAFALAFAVACSPPHPHKREHPRTHRLQRHPTHTSI